MKTWITAVIAVLLLVTMIFVIGRCSRGDEVRKAKAGETVAEGRTVSAVEAIKEIGKLGERADATDAEVEQAKEALRNAPPEDRNRVWREQVLCLQQGVSCQDASSSPNARSTD